ncbi:MAG: hypothetical protein AAF624_00255 [Bacteroidota bacterium]
MLLLRFTLLSDGTSDRTLLPMLTWLFREHMPEGVALQEAHTDLGLHRQAPGRSDLGERIRLATELYPCDVLFVHRDAERAGDIAARFEEMDGGVRAAALDLPCIPIVPVRMSEAWLLIDETTVREAAGRPRGRMKLTLPPLSRVEQVDAKQVLFDLLRTASGTTGRRRRSFSVTQARQRVAELIEDFSPLRTLETFGILEQHVADFCSQLNGA